MSNNNDKKRLAYVDFYTHKNTKSGDFLREILSEEFEITDFWWKPREKFPLNDLKKYDFIFFFHIIFPYQLMRKLKGKRIMWAPMYDGLDKYGAVNFTNTFLKRIFWDQMASLGVKVLKFSDKITESIGQSKLDTLKLKYYVKTDFSSSQINQKKLNIFFWDRGGVKFDDWIKIFKSEDINEILYFPNPDYGRKESNISKYLNRKDLKITLIKNEFLSKEDFLNLLSKCNVFVAPRKKEGIGMALVEAISKGMYVVGYNDSTMNEYIENENNGFLFDEKNIKEINTDSIINSYHLRKSLAEINYNAWLEEKKNILPFFSKKINNYKKLSSIFLFFISDINFLIKRILKINYFY
tara:strand:- start:1453 stop:2511 length:1059 start_codon:yes stop_codon:yes gene_type:complete